MRRNRQLSHEKESARGGHGFDPRSQQSFFEYLALVGKLLPQPFVVTKEKNKASQVRIRNEVKSKEKAE